MCAPRSASAICRAPRGPLHAPLRGLGPRAQAVEPSWTWLLVLSARQSLSVGVGGDELDAGHAVSDHVVDGVAARAADTDHLDHVPLNVFSTISNMLASLPG